MSQKAGLKFLPCGCSYDQIIQAHKHTSTTSDPSLPYPSAMSSFTHALPRRLSTRATPNCAPALRVESPAAEAISPPFHYYLPHISDSTTDFYTDCSWIAYDLCEPNEQAETEALLFPSSSSSPEDLDLDLPFIADDDWNYYLATAELPYHSSDEEGCLVENTRERTGSPGQERVRPKTKLRKKKDWEGFWLERKVNRTLGPTVGYVSSKVGRLVARFEKLARREKEKGGVGWNFRP
jgi:hypothetical protein